MSNQSIRRFPVLLFLATLAASVFASSASAADSHIVPNRYIVVLEDSIKGPAAVAEAQTEQRGGKLGFVYRHGLKGYSAELSKGAVEALRHDPRVASVEPDVRGGIAAQTTPTGIERIFATENKAIDIDEEDDFRVDVDVAVLDTGIDYEHPDLNVVGRTDCSKGTEEEASCTNGQGTDENSHGTHVAGTIAALDNSEGVVGVAPGARLWAVKVLDGFGNGYLSELIAGIDWITATREDEDPENDIDVANSSLRYWSHTSSEAFEKAISASLDAGVVHVVAAGNESEKVRYVPGNYPGVITVAAIEDLDGANGKGDDPLAWFSNFGSLIDIAAPGVEILSTVPFGSYDYLSGTSMASPHVAGAAALLAGESQPKSQEDVETIREALEKEGRAAEEAKVSTWIDTSEDGMQEPLLYLGSKIVPPPPVAIFAYAFGKEGSGNGELKYPGGLESDGKGNLWVADTLNDRIQKFDADGEYLDQFGKAGSDEGKLDDPIDIAIDSEGNLWVADYNNDRVQKFDPEGKYLSQIGGNGSGEGQFKGPAAIAIDSEGNLWVADYNNDRVQKFDSDGEYLDQFGKEGSENGQFNGPIGIATDNKGNAFVLDAGNTRVQRFDSEGKYLAQFGSVGDGDGQFISPLAIEVDPAGDIWVTEEFSSQDRIQKFDSTGKYLDQFGGAGSGEGQFHTPSGISVDSEGSIWISDFWNHRIHKWVTPGEPGAATKAASGLKTTEATLNGTVNPRSAATTYQFEYGTTTSYGSKAPASPKAIGEGVQVIEASEKLSGLKEGTTYHFRFVATNKYGTTKGKDQTFTTLTVPTATSQAASAVKQTQVTLNASVNPKGLPTTYQFEYGTTTAYGSKIPQPAAKGVGSSTEAVKVSETFGGLKAGTTYHYRVLASSDGGAVNGEDRTFTTPQVESPTFSASYGSEGSGEGSFKSPRGVAVDPEENIWVSDTANNRLQKLNPEGEPIAAYGSTGTGAGQFKEPTAIAVDLANYTVWVADTANHRLQQLNLEGEYLAQLGSPGSGEGQLSSPRGVAVDYEGNIWVADTGNYRIQKFSSEGEFIAAYGSPGTGAGQFNEPTAIAYDPSSGNLWVSDTGNNRLQQFDLEGKYLAQVASAGDAALSAPTGLSADSQGVWVADTGNDRIVGFDPKGQYRTRFGAKGSGNGELEDPKGVALGANGEIWVADTANHRIQKWLPTTVPVISSTGSSGVTASAAKALATINPEGFEATYQFEYGTTTDYSAKVPASKAIGSGPSAVEVSETLTGLTPNTTYHLRVVASSAKGTVLGKDVTFTTAKALPEVQTEAASAISETEATLNGTVDANGLPTTYQFEYGTTTSYGSKAPVSAKEAGSGTEAVKVSEKLSGLKPSTTYHFRITATNAEGSAKGAHATFETPPLLPEVSTGKAVDLTMTSATLRGVVDPEGSETTYQFEYGTSIAYGSVVPVSPKAAGSGTSWVEVSEPIGGLSAGTTYFFRIVATSKDGKVASQSRTFKTFSIEAPSLAFAFASYGTGNGQLDNPSGIAIDNAGNAWVVDSYNHRVQKLSPEGKYLAQFGSLGSGNGQLKYPIAVAIDAKGDLWVTDTGNDRVQKFSPEGKYLAQLGGFGEENGQLNDPAGIAIDKAGSIWVVDSANNRVQEFSPEGKYLSQFGEYGEGEGQLFGASAIAIDSAGDIWVLDFYNYRVQEFSSAGEYLSEFGEYGWEGEGSLFSPGGLAFDAKGNLWVTDGTGRVEGFSPEGQHLAYFGLKAGSEESLFSVPFGIAFDAEGDLWVTDAGYGEVHKWEF